MLIFIAIAIGAFILVAGSFLFGHDHDVDHDLDHDAEPTIGIFSMKVIGTLAMGFGAAGAIARNYGSDYLISSLWGLGTGAVLGLLMYGVLRVIYTQQASSLVETSSALGQQASVTTSIGQDMTGEIEVFIGGRKMVYLARSEDGKEIPKGRLVQVVQVSAGELIVKEIKK